MAICRIIEEVIFKSCPTPLGKKQRAAPTDQMKTRDRVERIINDLFEFGVPIEVLFDVDDLVKAKNIPKVRARVENNIVVARRVLYTQLRLEGSPCQDILTDLVPHNPRPPADVSTRPHYRSQHKKL